MFFSSVYRVISMIPEGKVLSYGDIAKLIGKPKHPRYVGLALKFCPTNINWHRVVRADGSIATGNLQVILLKKEGVGFLDEATVDIRRFSADTSQFDMSWLKK